MDQKEMEEQLKGMSKEEIQELVKKQCLFCNIINGNIEANKVYEDDLVMGVLDINPANKGHVLVFPKEHLQFLSDLDEKLIGHLFNVVNKLSDKMVEKLKAERKKHQNKCKKRQSLSKHKYAYILGKNRKETKELIKMLKVKTYPYPKERGL